MSPRWDQDPRPVCKGLVSLLAAIESSLQPNARFCPKDDCLLVGRESCPACAVRRLPRECDCGRRLRSPEGTQCWVCVRKQPGARPGKVCGCGVQMRTDAEQCSQCRKKPTGARLIDRDRPFRWVRRGGVLRPVFESEVA